MSMAFHENAEGVEAYRTERIKELEKQNAQLTAALAHYKHAFKAVFSPCGPNVLYEADGQLAEEALKGGSVLADATRECECPPSTPSAGLEHLASKIARDIMAAGDGPRPCTRIQFMGGAYPDDERRQGGFCESALARCIGESFRRHLPNVPAQRPPTKDTYEET